MAEQSKKNMLLLSGSRAAGNLQDPKETDEQREIPKPGFLEFAETWIKDFFVEAVSTQKPILFVPYARPGGISEEEYFSNVIKPAMNKMGIEVVCAPTEGITEETLKDIGGIFVGGGHTYTLLHKLQETGSLQVIRKAVEEGLPYMGSSAGTIITCPTIKTTNDMPCPANDIIDTRSLGVIGAQVNYHYLDDSMHDKKHQGETRDTRLKEGSKFNPNMTTLGLYEGQALRVTGDKVELWTSQRARGTKSPIFKNQERHEVECKIGVPEDVSRIFAGPSQGWRPAR